MEENKVDIKKLVVDGPPCSGKSTIMAKLIEHFGGMGFPVVTVPEAATELISNGITPDSFYDKNLFQKYLIEKILQNEAFFSNTIKRTINCYDRPGLVFCDRGLLTGSAYCDKAIFASILAQTYKKHEYILSQYDGVLHMRIAPEEYYTRANNVARSEDYPTACMLDNKTLDAWKGHHNLMIIGNNYRDGFDGKINAALQAVARLLGVPEPLIIERKFVISEDKNGSILSFLNSGKTVSAEIVQHYLVDDCESIRAWTCGNATIYFHRKKNNKPVAERFCTEKIITRNKYNDFLSRIDPGCAPIEKTRYYFVYEDQYFRLDVFKHSRILYLLEAQLTTSLPNEVMLPDFVSSANFREVTDDPQYYNYNIAKTLAGS